MHNTTAERIFRSDSISFGYWIFLLAHWVEPVFFRARAASSKGRKSWNLLVSYQTDTTSPLQTKIVQQYLEKNRGNRCCRLTQESITVKRISTLGEKSKWCRGHLSMPFQKVNMFLSVIPFDFSPSSQVFPWGSGIDLALLKKAVCVEESQRDVKKVHFLHAILTANWQRTLVSVFAGKEDQE